MKRLKRSLCLPFLLLLTLAVVLNACSSSDDGDPDSNPAGAMASSAPPNNLALVNMSFGGVGESAPIKGCQRLPRSSEAFFRNRIDLPTETMIGLFGVNFNQDGSFIDDYNEIGSYDRYDYNRNKFTAVFAVVDETQANATLTLKNLTFSGQGGTSTSTCFKFGAEITSGVLEITPMPGFKEQTGGFDKITYTVVDYSDFSLSSMIIAGDLDQSNLTVLDMFDLVKQNTVTIPILMLENSKVENGEFIFTRFVDE
jgi:hypothetical protein